MENRKMSYSQPLIIERFNRNGDNLKMYRGNENPSKIDSDNKKHIQIGGKSSNSKEQIGTI